MRLWRVLSSAKDIVAINWRRGAGELLTAEVGPFKVTVAPQGDGRWAWEIHSGDTPNPAATGIARSLGAAKNVVEQFVNRSGRV